MTLAAHQPNYLPWLGFFHKIDKCDDFVFLDNVQYEKREFQNRNKIRTKDGFHWLTVPVATKGLYTQRIREVLIDNTQNWQDSHWGMIKMNYRNAAYFPEHADFFSAAYSRPWEKLIDLNIHIIRYILDYLGISRAIRLESELNIQSLHTQRIVDICKSLKVDTYFSGNGARAYLQEEEFVKAGIKLTFQDFTHPEYTQVSSPFIPEMSIIDLIFNHGKESMGILRRAK